MKTQHRFLFVLFFLFSFSFANAQGLVDVNGLSAISIHPAGKTIRAKGLNIGFYTPPINLIKINPAFAKHPCPQSALAIRFGFDIMPAWMGKVKFSDVALKAPDEGNAKVQISNHFLALNASMRISSSFFNDCFHPYIEASAGYRKIASNLDITPDAKSIKGTDTSLAIIKGGSMGVALGVWWAFTDNRNVMINASVGWNHCNVNSDFIDLQSVHKNNNFIGYETRPSIQDFMMIKIGLSFMLQCNPEKARKYSENHPASKNNGSHSSGNGHSHVSVGHCSGHGR